jgi:hypothetical protein
MTLYEKNTHTSILNPISVGFHTNSLNNSGLDL